MTKYSTLIIFIAIVSSLNGQNINRIVKSFTVPQTWISDFTKDKSVYDPLDEIQIANWYFETKNPPISSFQYAIFYVTKDSIGIFEKKILDFQNELWNEYYPGDSLNKPKYTNFYYRNYYFMASRLYIDTENKSSLILQEALDKWIKALKNR